MDRPKGKAGLYMGSNFLATGIAAFSAEFTQNFTGHTAIWTTPNTLWFTLATHFVLGNAAIHLFTKSLGEFKKWNSSISPQSHKSREAAQALNPKPEIRNKYKTPKIQVSKRTDHPTCF